MGLTKEKIVKDFPEQCKRLEDITEKWCQCEANEGDKTEYCAIVDNIRGENQYSFNQNPNKEIA